MDNRQDAPTPRVDADTVFDPQADVTLRFYSRSADAPPGRGTGETGTVHPRARLHGWAHFRRGLSNFAVAPFEFGGRHWRTVEHAFQGLKVSLRSPEQGYRFTLDSGDPLGRADGAAAQAAGQRRNAPLTPQQLAEWDAQKDDLMEELWMARFSQDADSAALLDATGFANLVHIVPRRPAESWWRLERVRARLRGDDW